MIHNVACDCRKHGSMDLVLPLLFLVILNKIVHCVLVQAEHFDQRLARLKKKGVCSHTAAQQKNGRWVPQCALCGCPWWRSGLASPSRGP